MAGATLKKSSVSYKRNRKIILQALIRAAGAYLLLEHGRKAGARIMASKAVASLTEHKESVPIIFNVELLIAKLKALDPVPPKLGATRLLLKRLSKDQFKQTYAAKIS